MARKHLTPIEIGALAAQSGALRLQNNETISARDQAGSADVVLLRLTTADALALMGGIATLTSAGLLSLPSLKITTGAAVGFVLTSDADGDASWQVPTGGAPSFEDVACWWAD